MQIEFKNSAQNKNKIVMLFPCFRIFISKQNGNGIDF